MSGQTYREAFSHTHIHTHTLSAVMLLKPFDRCTVAVLPLSWSAENHGDIPGKVALSAVTIIADIGSTIVIQDARGGAAI